MGETSNFSSQLQAELHCKSPIPYHVFISCDYFAFDEAFHTTQLTPFVKLKLKNGMSRNNMISNSSEG